MTRGARLQGYSGDMDAWVLWLVAACILGVGEMH